MCHCVLLSFYAPVRRRNNEGVQLTLSTYALIERARWGLELLADGYVVHLTPTCMYS